ncbi:MAG: hypothetical protein J1F35_08710 [Erysipelotrichales bacterium]|nr:hypothetical protein [Erysipelotrichales bacterium]
MDCKNYFLDDIKWAAEQFAKNSGIENYHCAIYLKIENGEVSGAIIDDEDCW